MCQCVCTNRLDQIFEDVWAFSVWGTFNRICANLLIFTMLHLMSQANYGCVFDKKTTGWCKLKKDI